ncbi:MAG: GTPase [Planctomycetaceae bacterium]
MTEAFGRVFRMEHFEASPFQVTRLTAAGRGAVAVLRVEVRDSSDACELDTRFQTASGLPISSARINRIVYGHWGQEDVVMVRTTACVWEISCHGGEAAVSMICETLKCPLPSDFTTDATDSELDQAILKELLSCRTLQTARYLMAQRSGLLADFLESTNGVSNVDLLSDDQRVQLLRFLSWRHFADHLTQPWTVAVVGLPNAGKSSLMNAVLGYDRSIVFDQPGTTRDLVDSDIVLNGWPIRLIDTAGIRSGKNDEIESVGIQAARHALRSSDLCLYLFDGSLGWSAQDEELLPEIPSNCPVAVIQNKVDLCATDQLSAVRKLHPSVVSFAISAATGQGISDVLNWVAGALVPKLPSEGEPLPVCFPVVSRLLPSGFAELSAKQQTRTVNSDRSGE